MPDPRSSRPSPDRRDPMPEPVLQVIHDLALYARSQHLEHADGLLTEILAILSHGIEEPSHGARIRSECRALRVLRFLCEAPPGRGGVRESAGCPP